MEKTYHVFQLQSVNETHFDAPHLLGEYRGTTQLVAMRKASAEHDNVPLSTLYAEVDIAKSFPLFGAFGIEVDTYITDDLAPRYTARRSVEAHDMTMRDLERIHAWCESMQRAATHAK